MRVTEGCEWCKCEFFTGRFGVPKLAGMIAEERN